MVWFWVYIIFIINQWLWISPPLVFKSKGEFLNFNWAIFNLENWAIFYLVRKRKCLKFFFSVIQMGRRIVNDTLICWRYFSLFWYFVYFYMLKNCLSISIKWNDNIFLNCFRQICFTLTFKKFFIWTWSQDYLVISSFEDLQFYSIFSILNNAHIYDSLRFSVLECYYQVGTKFLPYFSDCFYIKGWKIVHSTWSYNLIILFTY